MTEDNRPGEGKPTGQAGTGQSEAGGDDANRGQPASTGSGAVHGSGAAAGGSGTPEDYDSDPKGGGGKVQQRHDAGTPDKGGDAPSHGSR